MSCTHTGFIALPLAVARIVAMVAALAASTDANAESAQPRSWQPLIIKGEKLPAPILGAQVAQLEVLAYNRGRLVPIPFEVDERLRDGRYALPKGPEPITDDKPGIMDEDDEMVVMISDMGERVRDLRALPEQVVELEMTDPLDRHARYAYVAAASSPRRSNLDYVDFDVNANRIESEHYRLGFTKAMPTDFALQDRKSEGRPNIIDRLKIRLSAKILMGLTTFNLNEADVRTRMVAYNDGPIRVIRQLTHSIPLMLGIRSPEVATDDFFYRDYIDNPIDVKLPWVPRVFFGDIKVRSYLDFNRLSGYSLSWSGMKGAPVSFQDGKDGADQGARQLSDTPVDWISFRGDDQTVVQTLIFGPDLKPVHRHLYVAGTEADPPENFPGNHPGVGYLLTGWEDISKGRHKFDSILLKAPGRDFDADRLLKELQEPPIVNARRVEPR